MANAYGRGGVAQTGAAQRGTRGNYNTFSPKEAKEYLSGNEVSEYQQAIKKVGSTPYIKKSGKMWHRQVFKRAHKAATKKAQNLRNIASGRAFGEFSEAAMQHSKPWLARAPEGVVTEQTVTGAYQGDKSWPGKKGRAKVKKAITGEKTFGGVDVEQARRYRLGQTVDFGT